MKPQDFLPWFPYYLTQRARRFFARPQKQGDTPLDLIVCFVDHFEPRVGDAPLCLEQKRMAEWVEGYPRLARKHRDSDGVPPKHTWFFPIDEYWDDHLKALADLQRQGLGEVEIHLHHSYDTSAGVRETLERACKLYAQHGLLSRDRAGRVRYAFIHGNWALDNSRGDARWCGVNDELRILQETGCYADFTFPSLIYPTQPRLVNVLYYAREDPHRPKSYDRGPLVRVGTSRRDGLLMVPGPVGLNWHRRKRCLLPTVENADVSHHHPPSPARVRLWLRAHVHVLGQPNWVFIKLHTHGAADGTREMFTTEGSAVDALFSHLESHYADGERYRLHYVTAREMVNLIRAAEAGHAGNPHAYRDFELIPGQ